MSLEIERSDWMRTPGRFALLRIGPFEFGVNTADSGNIGFAIIVGGWAWTWQFGPHELH